MPTFASIQGCDIGIYIIRWDRFDFQYFDEFEVMFVHQMYPSTVVVIVLLQIVQRHRSV